MTTVWRFFLLSMPLFGLVLAGYLIAFWSHWQTHWTRLASKFVFTAAVPAMLFHLMSQLDSLPSVDTRLLIAFFGGCLIVFGIGRLIAARMFAMDSVSQSVFALGGVFSNNAMLGLPLARMTLGTQALPSTSLILVFNALILWTLVTVSVESARQRTMTLRAFGKTVLNVLRNPIVCAILGGSAFGLLGWKLPLALNGALDALSDIAAPISLLVLGMGLRGYDLRNNLDQSLAICFLKLIVQPIVVWLLALLLHLPALETSVIVLLASMSVGVNVYLMSQEFQTLQGAVASSLLLSTALAAFTTPLLLALVTAFS